MRVEPSTIASHPPHETGSTDSCIPRSCKYLSQRPLLASLSCFLSVPDVCSPSHIAFRFIPHCFSRLPASPATSPSLYPVPRSSCLFSLVLFLLQPDLAAWCISCPEPSSIFLLRRLALSLPLRHALLTHVSHRC